jgi:hypothetical protein
MFYFLEAIGILNIGTLLGVIGKNLSEGKKIYSKHVRNLIISFFVVCLIWTSMFWDKHIRMKYVTLPQEVRCSNGGIDANSGKYLCTKYESTGLRRKHLVRIEKQRNSLFQKIIYGLLEHL